MKTIQEFDAKQAAEREAFLKQLALIESSPIVPKYVSNEDSKTPWVSFDADNLIEAAEIIKAYGKRREMLCVRKACTIVKPEQFLYGEYVGADPAWRVENAIEARCSAGRGFRSVSLSFYPESSDVYVVIDIKAPTHEMCGYISCNYDRYGNPTSVSRKDAPAICRSADQSIAFSGGSMDAADWRGYFSDLDALFKAAGY